MNELHLSRGGVLLYTAVPEPEADPAVLHAASELNRWLASAVGRRTPAPEHRILLGCGEAMRARIGTRDLPPEGSDGYLLFTEGEDMLIVGATPRAVLYGAMGLLALLGFRFYAPGVEKVPALADARIPAPDLREVPTFPYREVYYYQAHDKEFAVHNRLNGNNHDLPASLGGSVRYFPFVHSFPSLVPQEKYLPEHPEYYCEIDGVRQTGRDAQLCFSNPEVLEIACQNAREWILAHPEANIISLSQADGMSYCRCPKCAAIDAEEESHAGALLRFVNELVRRLSAEFPNVLFDTLAYQFSRNPPKLTRPHPRLIVRLCSIECCFSHPMGTCTGRRLPHPTEYISPTTFAEDLAGWGRIHDRLFIWDYVVNFKNYLIPQPNLRVLAPNIRFFAANHVTGVFEQGCCDLPYSEFAELRAWLLAQLLWNQDADEHALIREFCEAFYGPAAECILDYIELEDRLADHAHFSIQTTAQPENYPAWFLDEAEEIFARALASCHGTYFYARVYRLSLSIRYVRLCQMKRSAPGKAEAIDAFCDECEALGMPTIREFHTMPQVRELLKRDGYMKVWNDDPLDPEML